MNRFCKHCGIDITERHLNARYCRECYPKHHRQQKQEWNAQIFGLHRCISCGKPVSVSGKRQPPRQCRACYHTNMPKGSDSPTWKGGRITVNHYVYVQCEPTHIWARKQSRGQPYAPEHVINWEKAHNISLPKTYVVHHLNGIKSDNRPQNLMALLRSQHSGHEIKKALQKHIRQLEAIISQQRMEI